MLDSGNDAWDVDTPAAVKTHTTSIIIEPTTATVITTATITGIDTAVETVRSSKALTICT